MGAALRFNFLHFKISDNMPTDSEVQMMVLRNGQAVGATGMKAKHLKGWLDKIQHEEKAARENPDREGPDLDLVCKWRIFVQLIQII